MKFIIFLCVFIFFAFQAKSVPQYTSILSHYTPGKISIEDSELDCLTRNIYFEAVTQSEYGKFGVAQATLNRVDSDKFPNTICGVVLQGPQDKKNWRLCQFSWNCDGKVDIVRSKKLFLECQRIAVLALLHRDRDITLGATHYHAFYVKPWWSKVLKRTIQIGDHIFYREG